MLTTRNLWRISSTLFLIGDGEELLPQVVKTRRVGQSKEEYLKEICSLPGVYIPRFYQPEYKEDGTLLRMKRLLKALRSGSGGRWFKIWMERLSRQSRLFPLLRRYTIGP